MTGTLIIQRKSSFANLASLPWRLRGWHILVLDGATGENLLRSKHLNQGFDARAFHFILAKIVNQVLDQPFAQSMQAALAPLVGDSAEDRGRFRTALFKGLRDELRAFARMVSVCQHIKDGDRIRILPEPSTELCLAMICRVPGHELVAARALVVLAGLFRTIGHALARVARIPPARVPAGPTQASGSPPDATDETMVDASVAMFTHWGLRYGELYDIDYYFRKEPEHPLNPKNMLLLETVDPANPTYAALNGGNREIRNNFRLAVSALRRARLFSLRISRLIFFLSVFKKVLLVTGYRNALTALTKARLAIVGYDILCPTELVIAAQNLGMTCIAVQERFNSLYSPIHAFVLDDYYVFGPASAEALRRNPNINVRNCKAIGPIRSDWVSMPNESARGQSTKPRTVLVLDAYSYANDPGPDSLESNSWENNAHFLDHIVRLADRFPDHNFVIRGKDSDWTGFAFFASWVQEINKRDNLRIDSNYTDNRRSYELANEADLIIARYTSLGDEALAKGRPVIFHEETVTGRTYQSLLCDYEGYPVYAHDYESLEGMARRVLNGDVLMSPKKFQAFRERFYCADLSGTVQARLQKCLDEALATA